MKIEISLTEKPEQIIQKAMKALRTDKPEVAIEFLIRFAGKTIEEVQGDGVSHIMLKVLDEMKYFD